MRRLLKRVRYRFEWIAVAAAENIVPRLSRRAACRAGEFLGSVFAFFDRPGRQVARANVRAALGDDLSPARQAEVVRRSYQNFARTMVDFLWGVRLTSNNFREHIELSGLDEAVREVAGTRGCIFVTFHYGNFEWAASALGFAGVPLFILAQEFKNPRLDPIFAGLRTNAGHEVAPRAGGVLRLFKALKRGKHIALLTDLTMGPWQPSVVIDCFGLPACVTFAHAWLHRRTGAPIIPVHSEPLPDGRWRVMVGRPLSFAEGASDAEIANDCWKYFEPIVRRNPEPWLWSYKHWRYDLGRTRKAYPFYAQVGPRFEERLVESGAFRKADLLR